MHQAISGNGPEPASKAKKPNARKYSQPTLKVLFAHSGNQCAHPECTNPIIKPATSFSKELVVGQISHIYALSDDGPRGNPSLSEEQRNQPDNLMLFCPTHHVVVDGQHATYPATLLLGWKERHERKYRERMSATLADLGYAELEIATRALASKQSSENFDLATLAPQDKIKKNSLGGSSELLLRMGAAKCREVEDLLLQVTQLDEHFADRLRTGFVKKYQELRSSGLSGDDLFHEMHEWAGGDRSDFVRSSAGLCILTHLFIICDIFEK